MSSISPKISVLMSCYNGVPFLSQAIESILTQTFTDFEFILINDGSIDDTLAIIKDYAVKDSRIVVIEKRNTGLTDSLNVGIGAARGEWIARLDSDDVALPSRLQDQICSVYSNPTILLLGTGCVEIDENGVEIKSHLYPTRHHNLLKSLKSLGPFFPHSSAMFRRDIAVKIGGYNKRMLMSQDSDLWLRLSDIGNIGCLKSTQVLLRKHSAQISHQGQGKTQSTFGVAARVCFELRSLKLQDPSTSDDQKWNDFISWLSVRLEQTGWFDTIRFYGETRKLWNRGEAQSFWSERPVLIKHVMANPISCARIVWQRFFKSTLPLQLVDEWIQLTRTRKQNAKVDGS